MGIGAFLEPHHYAAVNVDQVVENRSAT
jgi:hypothetical protein